MTQCNETAIISFLDPTPLSLTMHSKLLKGAFINYHQGGSLIGGKDSMTPPLLEGC